MKVDFQIVHTVNSDIKEYLLDLLKQTLDESTTFDFSVEEKPENIEDWTLFNWIEIRYNYSIVESKFITGFSLEFDEQVDGILNEFGNSLNDDENIEIVFKYFDEPMFQKHKDYAQEIFELEMRLREVLSFVFIDTYKENYYNLLDEIDIKIQPVNGNNKPDEDYFKKHLENEFFFLLFSDYIRLDNLKKINQNDLMEMILNSNNYDELKENIQNRGIKKEKYKELVAAIKQNLKPIEDMRNCIAHNRSFTNRILENYQQAKEKLYRIIDDFWNEIA